MISRERWEKKFSSRAFHTNKKASPEVKDILEKLSGGALSAADATRKLTELGYSEKLAGLFVEEHLPLSSSSDTKTNL